MKHIKFSLIDDDFKVQTETNFDLNEKQSEVMAKFFNQISDQLATGQEGHFEVEGLQKKPLVFTVTNEELMPRGM